MEPTLPSPLAMQRGPLQIIGFSVRGEVASDPVVAESNELVPNIISQLEDYLSINATALNYTALWNQTKPDADLPSLSTYFYNIDTTYPTLISKK